MSTTLAVFVIFILIIFVGMIYWAWSVLDQQRAEREELKMTYPEFYSRDK